MTTPLIEFRNASVMRGSRLVLQDVNVTVQRGEHVAILGPNGCGKSTLIKTIQRELYPLRRPDCWVRIMGEELWNVEELRSRLGIVKNDLLPAATGVVSARELVISSFFGSVGLWNHQQPTAEMFSATEAALAEMEVSHLAERDIDELSSGESRRVQIARALVHHPETLLLDEPANNLDLRAQGELRRMVRKLAQNGTGLIMITHHVEDVVPEIDRVLFMRDGRIVEDGAKTKLLTSEKLSALFRWPVAVRESEGSYTAA